MRRRMKRRKKIHNAIILTITAFMAVLFLASALVIDSESWIPVITLYISIAWLLPFACVNGDILGRIGEDDVDR